MVVLKKVNAGSLIEVLVASVILMIVFTLAINTLNSMLLSSRKNDLSAPQYYINKCKYLYPFMNTDDLDLTEWNFKNTDKHQVVIENKVNRKNLKRTTRVSL